MLQIVYNMGGPLFVWGWFFFWVGISSMPVELPTLTYLGTIYPDLPHVTYLPLFINWRTAVVRTHRVKYTRVLQSASPSCLFVWFSVPPTANRQPPTHLAPLATTT